MSRNARIWAWLVMALLALAAAAPSPVQAQAVDWTATAEYQFGQEWTFRLQGEAPLPVTAVTLTVSAAGLPEPYQATLVLDDETAVDVAHTVDVVALPVQPFAEVVYSWSVQTASDESWQVAPQNVRYLDGSLRWQTATTGDVTVFWPADAAEVEPSVPEIVAGVVNDTLTDGLTFVNLLQTPTLTVVVYPSATDLRRALRLTNMPLLRDRPHPRLESVLVTVVNTRAARVDLARELPPALGRHFLYRAVPAAYESLPVWFVEGLTRSLAEPDPRFGPLLAEAAADGHLLPLASLCGALPDTDDARLLAEAQADSVVRFIDAEYDVAALLGLYAAGVGCETAVLQAFGVSLATLEAEWQQTLQPGQTETAVVAFFYDNLLWILLLLGGFMISALFLVPGRYDERV